MEIIKPIRATYHCRHYSYKNGPGCAVGGAQSPGVNHCLPNPIERCPLREEYTDQERDNWNKFVAEKMARLGLAVEALPKAIPLSTSGKIECPNCKGVLHYSRWNRGAAIQCETAHCVGPVHFNIAAGKDWPS